MRRVMSIGCPETVGYPLLAARQRGDYDIKQTERILR
jgi:hypothetical protein